MSSEERLKQCGKSEALQKSVQAPVKAGDTLGELTVSINGKTVETIPILAAEDVERLGFFGLFRRLGGSLFAL